MLKKYWSREGKNPAEIEQLCDDHLSVLKKHSALWDEFCGLSEASGVNHRELMILQNYTDLRDFSVNADGDDGGCSIIYYRKNKTHAIGQTWDMHASARDYNLYILDKDSGTHYLTITGCLALCGVNSSGVSVGINNLHSSEHQVGLAWPCLVKAMLECHSAEDARKFMEANMPSSAHNYFIADPTMAMNVETTGKRMDRIFHTTTEQQQCFFHTNHFLGKLKETEIEKRISKTTHKRLAALEAYFTEHSNEELSALQIAEDVLDGCACDEVYIPVTEDRDMSATCSGIWLDYAARTGWIYTDRFSSDDKIEIKF